ncbi:MAG: hypothetical protein OEO20_11540 [Gemmatimonadota bacterium]|nr:hypothetical protein [Gemmatimonadota bacterium]MDH3367683.1 hypothetical protein [Gemmatimonadota bacterium]MDH3478927.1 hypothetical protein [Gemmatimonadota bacterium]MDH3570620.1 hypothetical protein [Gemmatimonadota bacterium]
MAKIVDPDQLNQATEVVFSTSAKTVQLLVAGNLNDNSPGRTSGVTHQAVYSFTKEEWLATAGLQSSRFPFDPIFEAKFDWVHDWQPADAQTLDLLRDGGLRVVLLDDEYACLISLQDFNVTADQAYYYNDSTSRFTGTRLDFDKTGELNENILIYDGTNDYRDFLKLFLRIQGKTHGYGDLPIDQGITPLTYQAYRIPLSNVVDINVTESDANIDTISPYTEMRLSLLLGSGFTTWGNSVVYPAGAVVLDAIRQSGGSSNGTWWFTPAGGTSSGTGTADDTGVTDWESYAGEEQIGDEWFAFNRIIDLTSGTGTRTEIYEWGERQLRKTGNINAAALGTPNQDDTQTYDGELAMDLFEFVGDNLVTRGGVLVRDFDPNDTNNLQLGDITVDGGGLDQDGVAVTTTLRTYPFVSAGTLVFSTNLVDEPDVDTIYKMFFQRTRRYTNNDFAVTASSGDTMTLTSGTLDLTTYFANTEYVLISGFTGNPDENNGLFQVSNVAAGSMDCRRVNGINPVNETVGDTVNLDTDPYDSPDALVVNDNGGSPITGQITAGSIAFDFDYDGNVQGGRTPSEDAPVAVIAEALDGAQWVDGLFTITEATGLNFPLNAPTERVYANP